MKGTILANWEGAAQAVPVPIVPTPKSIPVQTREL
jgi:hypothetical protein